MKSGAAAACPEKGRNALNAARLLFDSTDMMRQHVIRDAVISGVIAEGGTAANIVPVRVPTEKLSRRGPFFILRAALLPYVPDRKDIGQGGR